MRMNNCHPMDTSDKSAALLSELDAEPPNRS
jgi:hypothetical protein